MQNREPVRSAGGVRDTLHLHPHPLSLLQGGESGAVNESWEPQRVNQHFPDLVKPLLPFSGDLAPALAGPPIIPDVEKEVPQQRIPEVQANELDTEPPDQGQVAHGKPNSRSGG